MHLIISDCTDRSQPRLRVLLAFAKRKLLNEKAEQASNGNGIRIGTWDLGVGMGMGEVSVSRCRGTKTKCSWSQLLHMTMFLASP